MKKQLHNVLIDFLKNFLPGYQKEVFERQRQVDNIVVWTVGLSTGAIALILSQASSIALIPLWALKISVGGFLLTIIIGVAFRVSYYISEQLESDLIVGFQGYCYGATSEVHGPIEITEQHTKEDIAKSLKEDMGLDLDYDDWLKRDYLKIDFWVDLYNNYADFWRKTEKEGLKNLGKALAPILGKSLEEAEEFFLKPQDNSMISKRAIKFRKICSVLYISMLILFVLSILSIAIGFFFVSDSIRIRSNNT